MSHKLEAIFDGTSIQPMIPLTLKLGTRVCIIVESVESSTEFFSHQSYSSFPFPERVRGIKI
jgi:hypothetical protein